MKFIARLFTILVLLIVIVVLAAGGATVYLVRKDFPQTDGTLQVGGLQARVEVIRDKYGVPHIYASNNHDLFFAEGYVHAQDRFYQMEFWRRVGAGRLSEISGRARSAPTAPHAGPDARPGSAQHWIGGAPCSSVYRA
jgi:penicillin amidase